MTGSVDTYLLMKEMEAGETDEQETLVDEEGKQLNPPETLGEFDE